MSKDGFSSGVVSYKLLVLVTNTLEKLTLENRVFGGEKNRKNVITSHYLFVVAPF